MDAGSFFVPWSMAVRGLADHVVMPVMAWSHAGAAARAEAPEIAGALLLAIVQVVLIAGVLRPLESWRPAEHWPDRHATRIDRAYTLLKLLGVLPLFTYAVMAPLGRWLGGDAPAGADDSAGLLSLQGFFPALGHHPVLLFLLYYLLFDLVQYGIHRLQHAVPWWWALHSLHHSQRQLNCWSNDRDHYLDDLFEALILAGAGVLLGTSPTEYAALILTFALLENFSHANVRLPFGRVFEKVLVGPAYHRLHHMRVDPDRPNLHNCNFALVFPVWDMLFGTALYGEPPRPTGVGDPMVEVDNQRGILGQQLGALRRFAGAVSCRAGWRLGDVAFGEDHRPVSVADFDLHALERGAELNAARHDRQGDA